MLYRLLPGLQDTRSLRARNMGNCNLRITDIEELRFMHYWKWPRKAQQIVIFALAMLAIIVLVGLSLAPFLL